MKTNKFDWQKTTHPWDAKKKLGSLDPNIK